MQISENHLIIKLMAGRPPGTSRCQQCETCLFYPKKKKCLNPSKKLRVSVDESICAARPPFSEVTQLVNNVPSLDSSKCNVNKKEQLIKKASRKFLTRQTLHPFNRNPLGYHARAVPDSLSRNERMRHDSVSGQSKNSAQCQISKVPKNLERPLFLKEIDQLGKSRLALLKKTASNAALQALKSIHWDAEALLNLVGTNEPGKKQHESPVVDEIIRSYLSTESTNDKQRLLSILVLHFSRDSLSLKLGQPVSEHQYRVAKLHALHWGAGVSADPPMFKHQRYSREDIERVVNFCLHPERVKPLAYTNKTVITSIGDIVNLGSFTRIFDKESMWKQFDRQQKVQTVKQISRTVFLEIVMLATGNQQKKMAALDINSVRYCFENFIDMKDLLLEIKHYCTFIDDHCIKTVGEQIEAVENFLKSNYKSHLKVSSRCASHCIQLALSSDDDDKTAFKKCNHKHDLYCMQCDNIHLLFANFRNLVEIELENRPLNFEETTKDADMIEEFRERIDLHSTHLNFYIGHVIRTHHSSAVKANVPASLALNQVAITADYKMKYLQTVYRESQQEWFGKAGMTWHGVWATVKRQDKFISQFFHNVSDDKKEDAFAVLSNIAEALRQIKCAFPELSEGVLMTDGAGAYSGAFLAIHLSQLGVWTGIPITAHYISESGQGKSVLDAIFGVLTNFLERVTRTGRKFDILKAADLKAALMAFDGIKGNHFQETIYDRASEAKLKKGAFPGLKKMHAHMYNYDQNNNFRSLTVHEQCFSNNTGITYSADKLKKMIVGGEFQKQPNTVFVQAPVQAEQLKFLTWDENAKESKKSKKMQRVVKKAQNKKLRHETLLDRLQTVKDRSRAFPCPTKNCGRVFQKKKYLLRHLALGNKCGPSKHLHRNCRTKTGVLISPDMSLKDTTTDVLKDHSFNLQPAASEEGQLPNQVVEDGQKLSFSNKYSLANGDPWKLKLSQHYKAGYARTWRIRGNFRYSVEQKQFLDWAFGLGVKNKAEKLTAHLAADLMKLVGTVEGELRFPSDPYMKATEDGSPKFKRKLLIMHYEIKSYFGQKNSKGKDET